MIWVGMMPGPQGFFGLMQGDFGWSFEFDRPVGDIVGDALWLTVLVNLAAVLFVYAVALPLGVLAAAKSETWVDYTAGFVGYLGLATPNFLLALILFYYGNKYFDLPIGGLMGPEFRGRTDVVGQGEIHSAAPDRADFRDRHLGRGRNDAAAARQYA